MDGLRQLVQSLVENGADINVQYKGCSLLHFAVAAAAPSYIFRHLITPQNVNTLYADNFTPLHRAVQINRLDLVRIFIHHGADVNLKNHRGYTCLHEALRFSPNDIIFNLISVSVITDLPKRQT